MSWQLDSSHSSVEFSVRHMMISTVRGRFEEFSGTFDINEADPTQSNIDVQIQVDSLNTRDAQRDGHVKSPDFFNVDQYPLITFKSSRIEKVDDNHYNLYGDLTIKDVTREVKLDVEYAGQAKSPWGTTSAGFTANTKIDRKKWGLSYNQVLETGGVLIGDDINVHIEVELVQQAEAVPAA